MAHPVVPALLIRHRVNRSAGEGFMSWFGSILKRVARPVGIGFGLLAVAGGAVWVSTLLPTKAGGHAPDKAGGPAPERLRRVTHDLYQVPAGMIRRVGLETSVVCAPDRARPRTLPPFQGTLAPDSNRYVRVHSPFAGKVMSIGPADPGRGSGNTLDVGDKVRKGDGKKPGTLLAVIWSKDLGEKKSELVDSLSRLWRDEKVLKALKDADASGAGSPRSILDATQAVESDKIAVGRAERTLRTVQVSEEDIAAVREEAKRLAAAPAGAALPPNPNWATVEIRAEIDGEILEKNVNPGDLVDTTTDLFRINDLSRLAVWVHVFEEDLPTLQQLQKERKAKGEPVGWTIALPSQPGKRFSGTIDRIGAVIDPNMHTALVVGRVDNPDGVLKIGQAVTATVELPPRDDEIELPTSAVVEDGLESTVFLQNPADPTLYTRVKVQVTRRFRDFVYARRDGTVNPNDRVVTSGSLLLENAVDQLPAPDKH
jgi:cobalt-zinc-cadmium efflux system membrane fusion protein